MSYSNDAPPAAAGDAPPATASACLGGIPCRYDGTSKPAEQIMRRAAEGEVLFACPECLGGLELPRPPAEIQGGDGFDVLDGKARVIDRDGTDVTEQFVKGARRFLENVLKNGSDRVYLKSKSPSCGLHYIYDGTFTGTLRPGCGVTAALLKRSGIGTAEI